jgi:hypothetical protein
MTFRYRAIKYRNGHDEMLSRSDTRVDALQASAALLPGLFPISAATWITLFISRDAVVRLLAKIPTYGAGIQ